MTQTNHESMFNTAIILQMIGSLGHGFFYWVQENFYGEPNFLNPISTMLNDQVSATTFFIVLAVTGVGFIIMFGIYSKLNLIPSSFATFSVFAWPIVSASTYTYTYTYYEYRQMLNPPYPDNHILDMILAWVACVIVLVAIKRAMK